MINQQPQHFLGSQIIIKEAPTAFSQPSQYLVCNNEKRIHNLNTNP